MSARRHSAPTVGAAAPSSHLAEADERSLVSYLLIPRPRDLVKTLLAPVTYAVVGAATGTFTRFGEFVALWIILEFLIYYARYQWNDARGVADDCVHPERRLRARLPVGTRDEDARRNVRVSLTVAGARIIAALLLGAALGVLVAVAVLLTTVVSTAIVYEALRSQPPCQLRRTAGPREVGVWIVVGLGYAIRAGLGLALADPTFDVAVVSAGLGFFAAFGTMYVLLNWTLESSNFCARRGEHWTVSESLHRKPHLSALLRHLDGSRVGRPAFSTTSAVISRRTPGYLGDTRVLDAHRDIRSPWNIALLWGAALGGLFGMELAEAGRPSVTLTGVALCVGGATGLCRSRKSKVRQGLVVVVAISLEVLALVGNASPVWPAAIPWLALAGCYVAFRSLSYLGSMGLGHALERWRSAAERSAE